MDLLKRFVEYLALGKDAASKATVKNYCADVGQFIKWFENEFNKPFNPKDITAQIIDVYKKSKTQNLSPSQKKLSPRSLERHLSSLRKFFHFLKIEDTISKNPLDAISNSLKNASSKKNKWHLNEFRNYLYVYNLAHLTIKNYVIDIKQFFSWLEQVTGINNAWDVREKNIFDKVNPLLINEYKERLLIPRRLGGMGLSPKTINRKLSSLRKYLAWAQEEKLIKPEWQDLQIKNQRLETRDHAEFILPVGRQVSASPNILRSKILNQVQDDTNALTPTTYSRFPPLRLLQKTTNGIIFVFDSFLVLPLASAIEQSKYLFWKIKGKPVFKEISNKQSGEQTKLPAASLGAVGKIENYRKTFYAPLSISTLYFPLHKKVWHHIRYTRPKWYKKYHLYPIVHYFHFAILVILMSAVGFTLYNDFIFTPQSKNVLSALDTYEPRILAFKGRLTDSLDNPITSPNTPLRAIIYNDPIASSSALLWQEVLIINPDSNGIFLSKLGVNEPIPQDIFSKNSSLWLGISIGEEAELIPRQELATVSFAVNSQTLQGLPPITNSDATTRNVVLALDSSGNLNIGESATPVFQATGGQFTLSGKVLLLTTVFGSDSNVVISPDGLGNIDLQKPLQNTSNNNNIPSAIGAVEIDDLLAVLATSSGQSALTINQDATGPIISASTSGTAKFTVENSGNIISAKGANWQPTFDSINGLNIASSSGIPFVTFDSLNLNVGIGTVIPETTLDVIGSFRASGDITLSKFVSNGGILYATGSGALSQIALGTSTQCLMGGTTPKFANCQASPYNNINETNGNIGIGTTNPLFKLDIQDSQAGTAAAQIFNTNAGIDADGLIVKLGNASAASVANSNHFISFETSGIGVVGSIQGNNGKGVTYATSGVADFAEYFKKDENQTIEYGSVVCIDEKGLILPCDKDNTNIVGVASEHPAFLGGQNLGNKSIAVGLVGQVPMKVSALNGEINAGDPLTSSDIPGVAVKATSAGQIIGKALESCGLTKFSNEATLRTSKTISYDKPFVKNQNGVDSEGIETPSILCSKILALVNISWYSPDAYLTLTGELELVKTQNNLNADKNISPYELKNPFGKTFDQIGTFTEALIANLQAGLIKTQELTTNSLTITTDSVTIAGKTLKEYISTVNNLAIQQFNNKKVISPIAETDEIHTNIISPLGSDSLVVKLATPSSAVANPSLIVQNASGSAVAIIDSSGNASFSGTLAASDLEVNNDATVAGTLRAKKILADSIEGLEARVSTLAANYIQNTRNTQNTSESDIQNIRSSDNLISPIASDSPSFLSAFGTFQGLMSLGPTSLAETAIAGNLSIQGTLMLSDNSINVLGYDLELQPLKQGGISFLSGLVKIDIDGNLKIEGNAEFAKDVEIKGNLVASGSATFNKLNLSLVQPALAISQTEIIATGSAGVSAIKAHQTELTIKNSIVTDKSLIYITPVGTPSAQAPFLMRQTLAEPVEGSFTVGIQNPSSQDTLFNWLIVN